MKTIAILYIICISHHGATSQIVPADACQELAQQVNDQRGNGSRAFCVFAETKR